MAFTNEEVLRMTELVLQKHNIIYSGATPTPPKYFFDFVNIGTSSGGIGTFGFETYSFVEVIK